MTNCRNEIYARISAFNTAYKQSDWTPTQAEEDSWRIRQTRLQASLSSRDVIAKDQTPATLTELWGGIFSALTKLEEAVGVDQPGDVKSMAMVTASYALHTFLKAIPLKFWSEKGLNHTLRKCT